ncbi:MAG: Glycosyltransferase [Phormidesmis priestleyi Ana]|uniref:Glycosyltransferase n=1 Tax=Phormidesmis priestleyi Ana TaxID=1666911 RepID=A0A0P8DCE7_9CYAN|nr:MAG: Glycosyltransferase [Phormidesmis priestleyi Ana]
MKHAFVFIEVFGCEGGIQSYIQDVLQAYAQLADQSSKEPPKNQPSASTATCTVLSADVFLLRDAVTDHPLQHSSLKYHYFKHSSPAAERIYLTLAFAAYLIRTRPDHVFCGHINLAPMVNQLCRTLKIPYTVLTYGKEVWYELPKRQKKALTAASRVWSISRYSRDLAHSANQIPKERFDMLPCVVDGNIFTPDVTAKDRLNDLLERYRLEDACVLMTVARLWPGDIYKGVDVTIRALPQIAKAFPTVKYVVIGRGDDQPRLAQLAIDLGVADRVVFAGFVPDEALIDHYRLADVYVMPSKEGFGIVYLEAMACGVPVIAGDDDGSADPLQDGRVGWQVPYRDPAAVAIACIEALTGKDPRCNGEWLRQETLANFSASALANRLDELLAKLKTS